MVAASTQFLRLQPTASLPTMVLIRKVCTKPSVCCQGTSWTPCWGSRSPESLVGCEDALSNSFRSPSWIHSTKLSEEILTPSGPPNQSTSTGKCGDCRGLRKKKFTTLWVLVVRPGEGVPPSSCTAATKTSKVCRIRSQQPRTLVPAIKPVCDCGGVWPDYEFPAVRLEDCLMELLCLHLTGEGNTAVLKISYVVQQV